MGNIVEFKKNQLKKEEYQATGMVGIPYSGSDFLCSGDVADALLMWSDCKVKTIEALGTKNVDGEDVAVFDITGTADTVYILTLNGCPLTVIHPEHR